MTASVTGSPREVSASRFSFCRMRALISCGVYRLPSISGVFQSAPMCRLTLRMVRSTLVTAWFLADWPTRTSPFLAKATTEGGAREPSEFAMTVGSPPSRTVTTELVVPRSIPTARAMELASLPCAGVVLVCSGSRVDRLAWGSLNFPDQPNGRQPDRVPHPAQEFGPSRSRISPADPRASWLTADPELGTARLSRDVSAVLGPPRTSTSRAPPWRVKLPVSSLGGGQL